MNPLDSLQQDWRMYYNNAWMLHRLHGPVQVMVMDERLYYYAYPDGIQEDTATKCSPRDLECWWPRSGAYNTTAGAIYITRKCSRSMRKSAHPNEHYAVSWGAAGPYGLPNIMVQLRKGPALVDSDFAFKAIAEHMVKSVAIAGDLILESQPEGTAVIFKGIRVGKLVDLGFEPDYRESALSRRVISRLSEEGVV